MPPPFAAPARRLRRLAEDGGATAVEFALVLPVLLVLYLGGVDVTQGITLDRKLTAVASAIGDLVAQAEELNQQQMRGIFDAAEAMIAPYDTGPLGLVVSSVEVEADGARVVCSRAMNADPRPVDSEIALPGGLDVPGTSLVVSEASYGYTPLFGMVFSDGFELSETFYLRPRVVDRVDLRCP